MSRPMLAALALLWALAILSLAAIPEVGYDPLWSWSQRYGGAN